MKSEGKSETPEREVDRLCEHGLPQDMACDNCGRSGFRFRGWNDGYDDPMEAWAAEVMRKFHEDLVQRVCDAYDYPALVRLDPPMLTPEAREVIREAWRLRRKWVESYKGLAEPSYFVIHSF